MSDENSQWDRTPEPSRRKEQFQPRGNAASRHKNPDAGRNLDKEEAARDSLILCWVLAVVAAAALLAALFFWW